MLRACHGARLPTTVGAVRASWFDAQRVLADRRGRGPPQLGEREPADADEPGERPTASARRRVAAGSRASSASSAVIEG